MPTTQLAFLLRVQLMLALAACAPKPNAKSNALALFAAEVTARSE